MPFELFVECLDTECPLFMHSLLIHRVSFVHIVH